MLKYVIGIKITFLRLFNLYVESQNYQIWMIIIPPYTLLLTDVGGNKIYISYLLDNSIENKLSWQIEASLADALRW